MASTQVDPSGIRVLVTGGAGFIGGRLVERLILECRADVRVLVRNLARAPRIARFPVELVCGDVTSSEDVEHAVAGSDLVFHCAYGNRGSKAQRRLVNVAGTGNVLEAALHHRVRRVIHLSTLGVYGITPDGDLDETTPRHCTGVPNAESKLEAEELVFSYVNKHGLPVTVLQPTVVYGPYAPSWTVEVLKRLSTGRVILVNGGDGLCNAVYVDDVTSAMLLAAVQKTASGEAFLISAEEPVTWREFLGRSEQMLGISSTLSLSAPEALAYCVDQRKASGLWAEMLNILREEPRIRRRILRAREVATARKVARSLLPRQIRRSLRRQLKVEDKTAPSQVETRQERPIHPLEPYQVELYKTKTRVRIDKARRLLGYQPAFDLEAGMRLTEQWARWANLLDEGDRNPTRQEQKGIAHRHKRSEEGDS